MGSSIQCDWNEVLHSQWSCPHCNKIYAMNGNSRQGSNIIWRGLQGHQYLPIRSHKYDDRLRNKYGILPLRVCVFLRIHCWLGIWHPHTPQPQWPLLVPLYSLGLSASTLGTQLGAPSDGAGSQTLTSRIFLSALEYS